jgi:hypothetical protein
LLPLFATSVNDAGVIDTSGKLPLVSMTLKAKLMPVSLTPVANLPPVSTTLVNLEAKFSAGDVDIGSYFARWCR